MCLYPKLIRNKKFTENKKNGGNVPAVSDPRTLYVPVGCQNCVECRKRKAREWQVRLLEDIKTNTNGKFITLTFSNESIKNITQGKDINGKQIREPLTVKGYTLDNQIATIAIRDFLERWRKQYKKSLRHWLVTELGHNGTENIHLHGIIWTDEPLSKVEELWSYGFMWKGKTVNGKTINYVNANTVSYITKYVTKIDEKHKYYKSLILTSPGIGSNYIPTDSYPYCQQKITFNPKTRKWSLRVIIKYTKEEINRGDYLKNKFQENKTNETYRTSTGHKIGLPIYWRNKIYSDEQREQLWIQKLNEQTRYICGEKIKTRNNEELKQYFKLLDWYRELNKELGYGNDKVNWEQYQYEQQLRVIQTLSRINKTYNNNK